MSLGTATLQGNLDDGDDCICAAGTSYVIGSGCVDDDECALGTHDCVAPAVWEQCFRLT